MNDTPHRILVVDDEPSITEFVSYALKKEGFFTDVVDNGEDALALATKNSYDLFVLDIMLPGMDGYELCRRLRSKTTVPVLFLSARDTELDKVVGLEIGGDDYITKPFSKKELVLRITNILRRTAPATAAKASPEILQAGRIKIDLHSRRLWWQGDLINLTAKEFDLILLLIQNDGRTVDRHTILRIIWDTNYYGSGRVLDDTIRRVRKKLPDLQIETVYGEGYRVSGL